jgi:hypothetical protein
MRGPELPNAYLTAFRQLRVPLALQIKTPIFYGFLSFLVTKSIISRLL